MNLIHIAEDTRKPMMRYQETVSELTGVLSILNNNRNSIFEQYSANLNTGLSNQNPNIFHE